MIWRKSETADAVKPNAVEFNGGKVYVRKNYKHYEADKDHDAKWAYDEACMSEESYSIYAEYQQKFMEQNDALIELADIIGGI